MRIRIVGHKGLKRFVEDNDPRELRGDLVNRIRNILAALIAAKNMEGVIGPRAGGFTSSQVTGQEVEHFGFGKLAYHVRSSER